MEDLTRKRLLGVALVRRRGGQFSAHVIQRWAESEEFGRDLLEGKGLSDLVATWQRALVRCTGLLTYFVLVPERREDLDPTEDHQGVSPYELKKRAAAKKGNNGTPQNSTPELSGL